MSPKKKYKIAVTDDHRLFREGIISLIKEYNDFRVIIEAGNGQELIDKIVNEEEEPDVVLLDLEMPVLDGIKTTEYLRKNYPHIKILILTMHDDDEFILHLLEKGVSGFLVKDAAIETVIEAIYSIINNEYYLTNRISRAMLTGLVEGKKIKLNFSTTDLSQRELEILAMICKEYTNKEISEKLSLSLRTVEKHRDFILQKTGARNTAGMVMYAIKNNLLA